MAGQLRMGNGGPKALAAAAGVTSVGRAVAPALDRVSGFVFGVYLVWLLSEWLGLTTLIPALRQLRPTTLMLAVLIAAIIRVRRVEAVRSPQGLLLLGLIAMSVLSVLWADVQSRAAESITAHLGYFGCFLITAVVVDDRRRCDLLAAALSGAILVLVFLNLHKFSEVIRTAGYRGGYFLGDANDFAWGLNTLAPFALYLAMTRRPMVVRTFGAAAFCAAVLGIVGTQSRGGALALAAGLAFYWVSVARRKTLGLIAVAVVVAAVLMLAPARYFDRLETIANYSEDNSAMSRLQVWRAGFRMALDYPLGVGAGNFASAYGRYYLPGEEQNVIGWGSGRWLNAHSVYFKIMGEYGFPGFAMLIGIIALNFRDNRASRRRLREVRGDRGAMPLDLWPAVLSMSLMAYAVAGMFLGGFSYPHLYFLSALPVAMRRVTSSPVTPSVPASEPVRAMPPAGLAARWAGGINPEFRMRRAGGAQPQ
jgi:probable O-glycosylation ligase (exosortase A-associated)